MILPPGFKSRLWRVFSLFRKRKIYASIFGNLERGVFFQPHKSNITTENLSGMDLIIFKMQMFAQPKTEYLF